MQSIKIARHFMSVSLSLLLVTLGCTPKNSNAGLCIGSENAKMHIVYLHGLDNSSPSELETANRQKLNAIAERLDARIALPRATFSCGTNKICWGLEKNQRQLEVALDAIHVFSKTCFPKAKTIGLIGFSNGGDMLVKIFLSNLFAKMDPHVTWSIAIGSGAKRAGAFPSSFVSTGKLTFIISKDVGESFDPQDSYNLIRKKYKNVQLIKIVGTHEIPLKETMKAVQDEMSPHLQE